MQTITKPRTVSLEEALRNLASRLTGIALTDLPCSLEAILQCMAENVPSLEEPIEIVVTEVLNRLNVDQLSMTITSEVLKQLNVEELIETIIAEVLSRLDAEKVDPQTARASINLMQTPDQEPVPPAEEAAGESDHATVDSKPAAKKTGKSTN